jgi:hypothetical protein
MAQRSGSTIADAQTPREALEVAAEPAKCSHRLAGLEPDNLLAFLALLGLLRALDTARPAWKARAHWDLGTHPLRPVLLIREPATEIEVAAAAAEGICSLAKAFDFSGRRDIDFTQEEARDLLRAASGKCAEVLASLMSDAVVNDKGKVAPTPYCFIFGQGHQHFLERLAAVPAKREPPPRGTGRARKSISEVDCIAEALFSPWRRPDQTDGFRWDPMEDRRYALRADDPSGDPAGMQHGANRMAAVGLPALSGAAILHRSELRFLARGTHYGAGGSIAISWPIWSTPARLSAVRALLAHPALVRDEVDPSGLGGLGVAGIMRTQRISVGKYRNVTPARWRIPGGQTHVGKS